MKRLTLIMEVERYETERQLAEMRAKFGDPVPYPEAVSYHSVGEGYYVVQLIGP